MFFALDIATPFVWAGAAALVAGVVWILSTATKAGIAEVVRPLIEPMHARLSEHLDTEEEELRAIHARLTRLEDGLDELRRR